MPHQVDALFAAVQTGDVARVEELLSNGSGPSVRELRDVIGQTLAHQAAMFDRAPMVERLKAAGVDLGAKDLQGLTPVQVAAMGAQARERNLYSTPDTPTLEAFIRAGAPVPRSPNDWPLQGRAGGYMSLDQATAYQGQVDRVATTLALADLAKSQADGLSGAQLDRFRCAVSLKPFSLKGPDRPVLLPAGAERAADDPMRKVLEKIGVSQFRVSGSEAEKILRSDKPRNPIQRTDIPRADAAAFLQTRAFKEGDAGRLGEIRGLVDAYLDARCPPVQTGKGIHYADLLKGADARTGAGAVRAGALKSHGSTPGA